MKDSVKRSLWRIGLLLLPILFVGLFSSCSEDDDEPKGDGVSNSRLVGTWMTSPGGWGNTWGYTFYDDGTCVCYDVGDSYPGTYEVRSDLLLIYWGDDETPEIFTSFSVSRNSLSLTDVDGDTYTLYRQGTAGGDDEDDGDHGNNEGNEDEYPFIGTWIEDADFATSENVQFVFEANGDFSYTYYEYSRKVYSGNGEWWVEYDEYSGDLELHVSDYTYGDSYYFSIRNSSSFRLTLREEHSDEVFSLTRRY